MTRNEALKELLKENVFNLIRYCHLKNINGGFKDDEIIIVDKNGKTIFKDKILNYDLDFESQKRFILDIMEKISSFVVVLEDLEDIECFKNLIEIDDIYHFDVLGKGDIYKTATRISKNFNKMYEDCLKKFNDEECINKIDSLIDGYIEKIKNNLDGNKVRVVMYYYDLSEFGFYVDSIINIDMVYLKFVDDLDELESSNKIDEIASCSPITLYYSLLENVKEADKAAKFIRKLIS